MINFYKKTVKMNILSITLLTFLLISTLSLSTFAMETKSVVDDFGDTISLNKAPEKIISMSPNITELLYALGLGEKVIAVSEECNYPEQMLQAKKNEEIKSIGFTNEPNIEKIIEMEADLVIADNINPRENVKRLKELGINVLALSPKDFDSSFVAIEKIGKLTTYQNEAKKLIENMKNDLVKIEELLNSQNKRPSGL